MRERGKIFGFLVLYREKTVIQPAPAILELPLSRVLGQAEPSLCPWQPMVVTQAQQQWHAAIAAVNQLLQHTLSPSPLAQPHQWQGVVLTGPVPVITCPDLMAGLQSWVFVPGTHHQQLLPAGGSVSSQTTEPRTIPLLAGDPMGHEQFCLVLTAKFSLVMVLGAVDPEGRATFQFSFSPDVVDQCCQNLRCRLSLTRPAWVARLDQRLSHYPPVPPDYPTVLQFSHWVLQAATEIAPAGVGADCSEKSVTQKSSTRPVANPETPTQPVGMTPTGPDHAELNAAAGLGAGLDLELLQAIAHEVRTPLATIKTLTQLLLKRIDLPGEVLHRLEAISRECAEQIDRFSLIFRAAELETSTGNSPMPPTTMASVSLADIFTEGIPRWQKQASRRHLTLELLLPQQLPAVKSDPTMLDQVLTGLIEHTTHRLPMGSHIQIEVTLAGSQLKLQVRSPQTPAQAAATSPAHLTSSPLKSVGQVLMVQPETGNLSLSLPVTKNLFQVLGGKLTVRQRAQQEEILTLFLPLGG